MTAKWYRPLMAAVALTMAVVGVLSIGLAGGSEGAHADQLHPYTIEISDTAVNPETCNISRGDVVVWKNIGSKVHRIIKPDAGVNSPPLYDSGDILPGQTSSGAGFDAGSKWTYHDEYDPSITGVIITPARANTQPANCSPLPPTPTPSPTRVPPTPTPTPALPPRCIGMNGCAVAASVASDS